MKHKYIVFPYYNKLMHWSTYRLVFFTSTLSTNTWGLCPSSSEINSPILCFTILKYYNVQLACLGKRWAWLAFALHGCSSSHRLHWRAGQKCCMGTPAILVTGQDRANSMPLFHPACLWGFFFPCKKKTNKHPQKTSKQPKNPPRFRRGSCAAGCHSNLKP